MSDLKLAQFQEAAVRHIVERLRDPNGSRRMLLADEVGLGKTVVAQGVIRALLQRRRRALTVIYLCSNAEIAEQNRTKLDPDSRKPVGRVTELVVDRHDQGAPLHLYSFTPGTSLKEGTGLAWERRLLLYLLHRTAAIEVGKKAWREFFRCGARSEYWDVATRSSALVAEFERKTSVAFQRELATAWRASQFDGQPTMRALIEAVASYVPEDATLRSRRNRLVAQLRGTLQRVVIRTLEPDLVILDEVQRFRDVLDEATNADQISAELFARGAPVLILSATPYRALTLGHEVAEGATSHHEDFFKTLGFLFGSDKATPARIEKDLADFGRRLPQITLADHVDPELLRLKQRIESGLTQVICRTERNWYVLDRRKGVDDHATVSGELPGAAELEEYFRLHDALGTAAGASQVCEFWKSTPSLLTFVDSRYGLFRSLRDGGVRVPRTLLTPAASVNGLAARNHRVGRVVSLALGDGEQPPRLWTKPTYTYYRDDLYGREATRKVLVFSGWRFVPKAVAVIASGVAASRLGEPVDDSLQPLRFTERGAYHVFDVCYPAPTLAEVGDDAFRAARRLEVASADDVLRLTKEGLRKRLADAEIQVVPEGGQRLWQVAMYLEHQIGTHSEAAAALSTASIASEGQEYGANHLETMKDWLDAKPGAEGLQLSEAKLERLAMIAAFSPAVSALRACGSVFGAAAARQAMTAIAGLCFDPMRRYFNRSYVQQAVRHHRFRVRTWRMPTDDRGYAQRVLAYSADAHLQAVLDEYIYLLKNAAQADTVEKAAAQLGDVWSLSRGTPRTNGARGRGAKVLIDESSESHSTQFALAFGDDVSNDTGPDGGDEKLRKSVVREAFNSPFWPFVLATTSVGQEGLDFHLYCRDVLHWNLPSNPVDLEQREGRVNRRGCLSVRQSIANDWALEDVARSAVDESARNPWMSVFDAIDRSDDVQKYKHGLFPHWVYECRDRANTVRIQRHVPFFTTSRDAAKYERLKTGLALYRLVFGQSNQEDLLDTLQRQSATLEPASREAHLKRLSSYMLNLSPIDHATALRHAAEEADGLLKDATGVAVLRLVADVRQLLRDRAVELSAIASEVDGLLKIIEGGARSDRQAPSARRIALEALSYLRNPYDQIFDLHVEGGFMDDVAVVQRAWAKLRV